MKIKLFLLTAIISLFGIGISAQDAGETAAKPAPRLPSASEILKNYIKAMGGLDAIKKPKNAYTKGRIVIPAQGISGTSETYTAPDSKFYSKTSIDNLGVLLEGFDDKVAWSSNPMLGERVKDEIEVKQTRLMFDFKRLEKLEKLYDSWKVRGIEKVNGSDAYVLVAGVKGLPDEIMYFDTKTHLLVRNDITIISPEGNQLSITYNSDYREVDGIKYPFKMTSTIGPMTFDSIVEEIKHNVEIDESIFSRPKN